MATITIPNVRRHGDVTFKIGLTDNGVAVDWSSLSDIRVFAFSDSQKALVGQISAEVNEEDHEELVAVWPADLPQYLGPARDNMKKLYIH